MSNKRDVSAEIGQLKSRKEFDTFWRVSEREMRVETILSELTKVNDTAKRELFKFIPVSLVATLESMLRSAVKKLIDEKESCFENAKGILPEGKLKIEFDYFKSLHKKEFTFGEFISHQVSCNRIENFNQALSVLMYGEKDKFFQELRKFNAESIYIDIPLKSEEFKEKYDDVMASLARIFELRHIACHEMSNDLNITEPEIIGFYRYTFLFLHQTYQYLSDFLYPNAPETDEEMFKVASQDYDTKEKELKKLLDEIKGGAESFYGTSANSDLLLKAQEHWDQFRKLYAEALLYEMRDGRDYRIFYLEELSSIAEDRIFDLKHDFKLKTE